MLALNSTWKSATILYLWLLSDEHCSFARSAILSRIWELANIHLDVFNCTMSKVIRFRESMR